MKQLQGDNRGLSLIEVLIAVTILAIVVTPFLHSFVTAATANSRARGIHKATVVAQSVMEGFKAETVEELTRQFGNPTEGFYVLPADRIGGEVGMEAPEEGVYYFHLDGVKEDTSSYDVRVKLDATGYRQGSAVEEAHQYNEEELAKIPVIDLERDAMTIQKESYTDSAVEDFRASHSDISEEEVRAGLKRVITISVDRTRVGTEYRTVVSTECKYSYPGEVWDYVKRQTNYDSMETEQELRSVYLYFYPLYSGKDEIVFKNNEKRSLNLYLMKQKSDTATMTEEEQYNLKLSLYEADAAEATMQTKLFTNLGTNLVTGAEIAAPAYSVLLNDSLIDLNNIASKDILVTEKGDRMYDIEVSIYEAGARAEGYPEDRRLATMEGNKID